MSPKDDGFYPVWQPGPAVVGRLRSRGHRCDAWEYVGTQEPGTVIRCDCGRRFFLKPITATGSQWVRYRWWHGRIDDSDVYPRSNGRCTFMSPPPDSFKEMP